VAFDRVLFGLNSLDPTGLLAVGIALVIAIFTAA
jgi:hypothetical protein